MSPRRENQKTKAKKGSGAFVCSAGSASTSKGLAWICLQGIDDNFVPAEEKSTYQTSSSGLEDFGEGARGGGGVV